MAEQKMHLPLDTMRRIALGKKDVEARLFDQRRRKLEVGDTLILIDSEKRTQVITVNIIGITQAKDFGELFDVYGPIKLGVKKDISKDEYLALMSKFYYHLDVGRLGVVGIELAQERSLQGTWTDPSFKKVIFTLHETTSFKQFQPIKQSYGICFNKEGEVLIGRCKTAHAGKWILPGGSVESGEDPITTLHRELDEEVSITIKKPVLLGVQQVEFLEKEDADIYQLRFVAEIKKVNELTPDPDTGELWERKFVPIAELNSYLKWGLIGDKLALKAAKWLKETTSKKSLKK